MEDKAATWQQYELAQYHAMRCVMDPREACISFYKTSPTPLSFGQDFARALGLLERSLDRNRGLKVYLRGFLGSF